MLEFIADKCEPVESNKSVEVTGIIQRSKNYFRDENGWEKKVLRDVIKQTAFYILCGKFELT